MSDEMGSGVEMFTYFILVLVYGLGLLAEQEAFALWSTSILDRRDSLGASWMELSGSPCAREKS